MANLIHPARMMSYADLIAGLEAGRTAGMIWRRCSSDQGLALYIYSQRCVFDDGWDEFARMARGLIVDVEAGQLVATPFPKFFNLGERHGSVPDLPFEAFEKLDGSLIIIFHHANRWKAATKGAFDSAQALWAQARLDAADLSSLTPGSTYLAEAVYPENRIVVRYADPALVMLGGYDADGRELSYADILHVCGQLGWRAAERHAFVSIAAMVEHSHTLPATDEGLVVRFSDGARLKIKGDEYRRIHALISRCTPLSMWEAVVAGSDMDAIRRDLPEEFWSDFDAITRLLAERQADMEARIAEAANGVAHLSDKELGLSLASLPADVRPFVFAWRKAGGKVEGKNRAALLRVIRPTNNDLPGYVPSYAMGHVMDEAA